MFIALFVLDIFTTNPTLSCVHALTTPESCPLPQSQLIRLDAIIQTCNQFHLSPFPRDFLIEWEDGSFIGLFEVDSRSERFAIGIIDYWERWVSNVYDVEKLGATNLDLHLL